MTGKEPWWSKTLWVNVVGVIAIMLQWFMGWSEADALAAQTTILAMINIFLRLITGKPIEWPKDETKTDAPKEGG